MFGFVRAEKELVRTIRIRKGDVPPEIIGHAESMKKFCRNEYDRIMQNKNLPRKAWVSVLMNRLLATANAIDGCYIQRMRG